MVRGANMEKRILGKTGFEVSMIGFGGIPIQKVDYETASVLIQKAHEEGINFIDTARGYKESEKLIGYGLEKCGRDKWIVATKSPKRDYAGILEDIRVSLENLRTDYIDLYQLHNVRTPEEYETVMGENGALKGLKEAKEKGLIREFGITSHNIDILEKVLDSGEFSTIQCPYNPVERKAEGLFKRAKDLNVGVIVMKPVAGGAIRNVNLSIRYIVGNPNVTVAIPGMNTIEQVLENSRIGNDFKPLTVEERTTILKEAEELGSEFCRRCGYCAPCPQGIDIPTQFLLEGYYTRYNLPEWAKERYAALDKKADNCVECGQCEKKCPYNLPIRKMLKKVVKTLG